MTHEPTTGLRCRQLFDEKFDERDFLDLAKALTARDVLRQDRIDRDPSEFRGAWTWRVSGRPLVGDYLKVAAGVELPQYYEQPVADEDRYFRFAYRWTEGLQISMGGSFYLQLNGAASMSGGLYPTVDYSKIVDRYEHLRELRLATFWFFHHQWSGAGRGTYFEAPVNVYHYQP